MNLPNAKVIDAIDAALDTVPPSAHMTVRTVTQIGSALIVARDLITGRIDIDAMTLTLSRTADHIDNKKEQNA